MDYTIEDYLVQLHTGQWFGFDGEHIYTNLVIYSGDTKPTEQECIDGVAAMQAIYDSQEYARNRKAEYDLLNQYELMFDDQQNGTTTWVDSINAIKAKYPKENT